MLHASTPASQPQPAVLTAVLGIDVAKATLAVHDTATGATVTIANTATAIRTLLAGRPHHAVVAEATGGHEALLFACAHAAGLVAFRVHPNRVLAFARASGRYAKTDAIDAATIAAFAQTHAATLRPSPPPDPARDTLRQLARRRDELVAMRTQETNRRKSPGNHAVQPSITRLLKALADEIRRIEAAITDLLRKTPQLAGIAAVLTSNKGVGATTAANLLAAMPELGSLTGKQVASLAGLAPHPRDSGTRRGYRSTGRGRRDVRRILFMATLAAARHNPVIRNFYQRLIANGKKPLIAITAAARKLLVILNAKLREHLAQQS